MSEMGRFLLVELEGGLYPSRYVGLFHNMRLLPGVHSVTDLAAITTDTLDLMLFRPPPSPVVEPEPDVEQLELV